MVFGIPVLVADSPGIREHVHHRIDGILAESTEEGLRGGIKEVLELSISSRLQIGEKARKKILEN